VASMLLGFGRAEQRDSETEAVSQGTAAQPA